ncbi:hypothetical protein D5018_20835 [Parashewanella curva]|uniref:Uncharacterized protein n=1 Tax=Parashewanella curva TaxID=2338552 RepID=A0A3L8PQW1_9GAMM|nr:DUF6641 family protein [Parashewanella curva]RLV57760.1 hypothetical protein D5018_20835 [Parashewanella curva]
MTNVLSSLKVIARPEIVKKPPVLQKRLKLIEKLEQQLEMVECLIAGTEFECFKDKTVKDPETGERKKVKKRCAVRPWYYESEDHYYLEIKQGIRVLELDKGKQAIDVGEREKIPETIRVIIDAVEKGELDHLLIVDKKAAKASNKASKKADKSKS